MILFATNRDSLTQRDISELQTPQKNNNLKQASATTNHDHIQKPFDQSLQYVMLYFKYRYKVKLNRRFVLQSVTKVHEYKRANLQR